MFGYVKAYKPELRMCEFEAYKSVYCGLCKEMGKRFGLWARFTLSYDFTFLALVSMALAEEEPSITPGRCTFNPLKKANCCHSNSSLSFAADMAILMLWHKLDDNRRDGGFFERTGSRFAMGIIKKHYRAAAERNSEVAAVMAAAMSEQAELERQGCVEPDKICHPSAHILGSVLQSISKDATQGRVLYRLGYLMGRYVYLCDALDDMEQDEKSGGYNPFLRLGKSPVESETLRDMAKGSLFMTIAEAGAAYELLDCKRFGSILENILYLGLRKNVEYIFLPRAERPKSQKF